jgi:hypothetical protein
MVSIQILQCDAMPWSVVAEWLGRGFQSRRRHGAVSVSRIPSNPQLGVARISSKTSVKKMPCILVKNPGAKFPNFTVTRFVIILSYLSSVRELCSYYNLCRNVQKSLNIVKKTGIIHNLCFKNSNFWIFRRLLRVFNRSSV